MSAEQVIEYLAELTSEERIQVIDAIKDRFCMHCGVEQNDLMKCQCWNDE